MKKFLTGAMFLMMSGLALASPKYVFMFIGDGLGASQRQIAEYYQQEEKGSDFKLNMNKLPVSGLNTTHSINNLVTDSAAAGTALATGKKTNNGMIAMSPNGEEFKSVLEYAQDKGKATGIVTTTRITHATPSAFIAKNESRRNENEIAKDFVTSNIDYIAGGGYRHFVSPQTEGSKREDKSLVTELRANNYKTFIGESSIEKLNKYKVNSSDKVFISLSSSHLPYEIDRMNTQSDQPSLADLTEKGIEVLKARGKDGFFMMIEGGRIDHASHANDVSGTIHDTLAFDESLEVAMDFYNKNKDETLILVVGDHETGGLGIGTGSSKPVDLSGISNVKVSVDDGLANAYNGNRKEYFSYIAKNLDLKDLTDNEIDRITKAMDTEDSNKENEDLYGGYSPTSIAVSHIINDRSGIGFTTFDHTASQIPMSAIGKGSEAFGGFKDNTEIGEELIKLYN